MNKAQAREIDNQIKQALAPVMKKNNLILTKSNGRFGLDSLKLTFEFNEVQKGENTEDATRRSFDKLSAYYNLQGCYGRSFTSGGNTFKVCGINPKSRKYPILGIKIKDGKRFKFSALTVTSKLLKG